MRAAKRQAKDLHTAAVFDYWATLLAAFGDVANSLRAVKLDARALQSRQHALQAARTNLDTAHSQLSNGIANQKDLYIAQAQYQSARRDCVKARIARYRDSVDLFRALGGGWQDAD